MYKKNTDELENRFVHIFFWILKEDTVRWVSARKSDTLKR